MEGLITTTSSNGVSIKEGPRGNYFHLIYNDDGKVVYLSEGDVAIGTTGNYYCATTQAEIQAVIDTNILYFDDTSEISDECVGNFFSEN